MPAVGRLGSNIGISWQRSSFTGESVGDCNGEQKFNVFLILSVVSSSGRFSEYEACNPWNRACQSESETASVSQRFLISGVKLEMPGAGRLQKGGRVVLLDVDMVRENVAEFSLMSADFAVNIDANRRSNTTFDTTNLV